MATAQQEFSILKHRQQLLAIMLFSLMAIVVWVGAGLLSSQESTSISPQLQQASLPLNPSINVEILGEIEQQTPYDPSQLTNFPIYTLLTDDEIQLQRETASTQNSSGSSALSETLLLPSPSPSPTPTASDSATPTATESAATPTPAPIWCISDVVRVAWGVIFL